MGAVVTNSKRGCGMRSLTAFLFCLTFLVCSACSGRDTSTLSRAIIGHWRLTSPDGSSHFDFYIRPDGTIIFSESEKPGIYQEKKYKVGKQNTNFNTIEISMQKDDGTWEELQTYSLSKDFTEMDIGRNVIIKYIDSKLSP